MAVLAAFTFGDAREGCGETYSSGSMVAHDCVFWYWLTGQGGALLRLCWRAYVVTAWAAARGESGGVRADHGGDDKGIGRQRLSVYWLEGGAGCCCKGQVCSYE